MRKFSFSEKGILCPFFICEIQVQLKRSNGKMDLSPLVFPNGQAREMDS